MPVLQDFFGCFKPVAAATLPETPPSAIFSFESESKLARQDRQNVKVKGKQADLPTFESNFRFDGLSGLSGWRMQQGNSLQSLHQIVVNLYAYTPLPNIVLETFEKSCSRVLAVQEHLEEADDIASKSTTGTDPIQHWILLGEVGQLTDSDADRRRMALLTNLGTLESVIKVAVQDKSLDLTYFSYANSGTGLKSQIS